MASTSFSAAVGRQQFLQLFVTQLKNQDPLEPTKQEEFLSQLAQFSTVEGIENINGKFDQMLTLQKKVDGLTALQTLNSGAALIGKQVSHGTNGEKSGVVSEVRQTAGQTLLKIGGQLIPVTQVFSVAEAPKPLSSLLGAGAL